MARDVGARFNNQMGEIFVFPQAELQEKTRNTFRELMDIKCLNLEEISSIFSFQKTIKNKDGYRNDSTPLEEPKKS